MKNISIIFMATMLLAACAPKTTEKKPIAQKPTVPKQEVVFEQEEMDHDMDMGDHMMMETPELQLDCATLTAKSDVEKGQILDAIAHNMDKNALDMILGKKCAFLGDIVKVADLTTEDLQLIPSDNEELYFNPTTNRYFATCSSVDTVAYVVLKAEAQPAADFYFHDKKEEFVGAATMAKKMMDMMMNGEHDMDMMDADEEVMDHDMDEMVGDEVAMDSTGSPQVDDHGGWVDQAGDPGQFTDYVDGVIGNGMESVLFFHAEWCPNCKANEERLNAWYGANKYPRSVYKIDYDTATDLKQMFGIVQQDTFVLIDGNGNEVDRVSFPSEAKLQELIGA